mgnify:FL=1
MKLRRGLLLYILFLAAVGLVLIPNISHADMLTLRPSAAGDSTQWTKTGGTANWDTVDEATADDDTTFVATTNTTNIDNYNLADSGLAAGATINSVILYVRSRHTNAASVSGGTTNYGLKISGTNYSAFCENTTSYATCSNTWTTNPNTSQAWTSAAIDALQTRIVKNSACKDEGNNIIACTVRVTQVYLEVDYTPAPASAASTSPSVFGKRPGVAIFYGAAFPMGSILIYESSILIRQEDINQTDGSFSLEFSTEKTANIKYDFIFVDKEGLSAPVKSISTELSQNEIIKENVSPPPTISLERTTVGRGESILINGSGVPGATVEIIVDGDTRKTVTVAKSGHYSAVVNTILEKLGLGSHQVSVRQKFLGQNFTTGPSLVKRFVVTQIGRIPGDFNEDGRVDIADLSIFIAQRNDPRRMNNFDLNADGKINIVDFSIFLKTMTN